MFFGLKSNACVPHINIPVVKISQIKCMQKPRAIDQRTRCFTNVSTESLNAELGGSGFCEAKSGLNMAIYSPAGLFVSPNEDAKISMNRARFQWKLMYWT